MFHAGQPVDDRTLLWIRLVSPCSGWDLNLRPGSGLVRTRTLSFLMALSLHIIVAFSADLRTYIYGATVTVLEVFGWSGPYRALQVTWVESDWAGPSVASA